MRVLVEIFEPGPAQGFCLFFSLCGVIDLGSCKGFCDGRGLQTVLAAGAASCGANLQNTRENQPGRNGKSILPLAPSFKILSFRAFHLLFFLMTEAKYSYLPSLMNAQMLKIHI